MNTVFKTVLAIIVMLSMSSCGYNNMVELDESVNASWADVESQYQRRSDLIPNLVKTVRNYADFEKETLTKVVEARAKATSITLKADDLSPANIAKFQKAQSQLSGALSRLLVTIEKYPDLKANKNYLQLQAQLEGTENRINRARGMFNDAARGYNTYTNKFPQMIYSGWFGFDDRPYYKAEPGSEKAPDVDDSFNK